MRSRLFLECLIEMGLFLITIKQFNNQTFQLSIFLKKYPK
jgi:hypothetical protein